MENGKGTENGKGRKESEEMSRAPTINDSVALRVLDRNIRDIAGAVARYRDVRRELTIIRLKQDALDDGINREDYASETRACFTDSVEHLRYCLALFAITLEDYRDDVMALFIQRSMGLSTPLVEVAGEWQRCQELCGCIINNEIAPDADLVVGSSNILPSEGQIHAILEHGTILTALLEDAEPVKAVKKKTSSARGMARDGA